MSTAHVPPGEGKSTWIANNEFVTFKATGKDTGGVFALVEVVGLPGSGPPPHIHPCVNEVYCLQEGELEVLNGDQTFTAIAESVFHIPRGAGAACLEERDDDVRQDVAFHRPGGVRGVLRGGGGSRN